MAKKKVTAGIILAAGISSRFGQPKQLLQLKNKCLLDWVLDAALASQLQKVIVVLGYEYNKILQALATKVNHPRLQVLINHRYLEGQSQSLQIGLLEICQSFASVMFLLGDQPMLSPDTINIMLNEFWNSEKDICVPVYKGKRGNPTIFSQMMYEKLFTIHGDIGARDIIQANPSRVLTIEVNDPLCFFDIDSAEDFDKLRALLT
jgi:molybdenum cofactor cytidylyltransferase